MRLQVLYFASLRERVGTRGEEVEVPAPASVADLVRWLAARGGPWQALTILRNLRSAVNQEMAGPDTPLAEGDEVAFFPPVTGG